MLQMTFGVDERDVRFVIQKHWNMAVNPNRRTLLELTKTAWRSMKEEDGDRIANAALDAYLEDRDESEAAHGELRKYLIERRFLTYAPRPRLERNEEGMIVSGVVRMPERRRSSVNF